MSDSREKQSTTGERKAIAKEAVAEVLAQERERERSTPTPNETQIMAQRALTWFECEKEGPAKKLSDRVDDIEKEIGEMKLAKATEDGANREIAREAGKYGALRMAAFSAALSMAVGLGLFALNRVFPPVAHASPAPAQVAK